MNTQQIKAYLERAHQCARRAAQTDDETGKLIYEELARLWRYLAEARVGAEKALDALSLEHDKHEQRNH